MDSQNYLLVTPDENEGRLNLKRDHFYTGNESSNPAINFQGDLFVFRGVFVLLEVLVYG